MSQLRVKTFVHSPSIQTTKTEYRLLCAWYVKFDTAAVMISIPVARSVD